MTRRRVKITGIGPITPAGIGREAFASGIVESKSRIKRITEYDPAAGKFVAAQVEGFDLRDYFPDGQGLKLPRHTQFALSASKLAMIDAGIEIGEALALDPMIVVGAALMDFDLISRSIRETALKGPRRALGRMVHAPTGRIAGTLSATLFDGKARAMALQSACCSGLDSIGYAAEFIASGQSDFAICGGTEAPLFQHPMLELKLGGMAPDNDESPAEQCRPYDRWRTTGVIGEGACMMVLEPESSPRAGYGFVEGYAFGTDSVDAPGSGLKYALTKALANGRLRPSDVDHVNGWGPGHRQIDKHEAKSLHDVFGPRIRDIPVASIKGAIANPLAAAGAIQIACAALSLRHDFVPPTVNWEFPDPDCPLNLANVVRHLRSDVIAVDAHGLSGINCCLILKR